MYRIIRGRYRLNAGGSVFYFTEPDSDLVSQSYEIYEESYNNAYGNGSYTDSELSQLLIENNIWTPLDDRFLKEKQDSLDNLKLEAFHNFLNKKELNLTKRKILLVKDGIEEFLRRKHSLDHTSCHGIAENARLRWLISKCVNIEMDTQKLLEAYQSNLLSFADIREVAKSYAWRNIWLCKDLSPLFPRNAVDFTQDQLTLSSLSRMYDNVYEHPDRPKEELIQDDDCLDGWFIYQQRKIEKEKSKDKAQDLLRNPKIRNADEVFIMASSKEEAEQISSMNNPMVKQIINQRNQVIQEKGKAKQGDFMDVRQDLEMQKTQLLREHLRKRK